MKNFEELGVSRKYLKQLKKWDKENPMPVQEEVIPYLLGEGNDVVALAQTGTGKTAAFGLPIIQKLTLTNVFHNRWFYALPANSASRLQEI